MRAFLLARRAPSTLPCAHGESSVVCWKDFSRHQREKKIEFSLEYFDPGRRHRKHKLAQPIAVHRVIGSTASQQLVFLLLDFTFLAATVELILLSSFRLVGDLRFLNVELKFVAIQHRERTSWTLESFIIYEDSCPCHRKVASSGDLPTNKVIPA